MERIEFDYHGSTLSFETGAWAKQADGAIIIRYGDTVVMVTAVRGENRRPGGDFMPLVCDYQEKTFAAGKFPGGFYKREGRPTEKETLTSRLIDRPLRPNFPEGYTEEVQIVANVLSKDDVNESDVLAITAASAALHISRIPFLKPVAAVRVARVEGEFVCNPTQEQVALADLNIVVCGSKDAILMVEGEAKIVPEKVVTDALFFAHEAMQPLLEAQEELRKRVGVEKMEFEIHTLPEGLQDIVNAFANDRITENFNIAHKQTRYAAFGKLIDDLVPHCNEGREDADVFPKGDILTAFHNLEAKILRHMVLIEKRRIDGRSNTEVRPIECHVGVLPRPHGTALFQRGETQALVVLTLGTKGDEQRIETLTEDHWRRFLLHYNFPPFSVGEVKMLRGPGRREIGHGALARRALKAVLPTVEDFPYTMRIVSEIMESNGSSSMASVCGGSLSMMDAGVPITAAVAGVAMGLMQEGDDVAILTDILGDEDHLGDMDFKVAGTSEGITAIQMDIKIAGLSQELMEQALEQARLGRMHILGKMNEVMDAPRAELSPYAPRITTMQIPIEKIKDVIGPGGKVIRSIIEETGVRIDVDDTGKILLASSDGAAAEKAMRIIKGITAEPEVGKCYYGKVTRIMDFGAVVELFPGVDGLVHISQLADKRVEKIEDEVQMGDVMLVRVLDIDPRTNRIRLSRRDAFDASPDEIIEL